MPDLQLTAKKLAVLNTDRVHNKSVFAIKETHGCTHNTILKLIVASLSSMNNVKIPNKKTVEVS